MNIGLCLCFVWCYAVSAFLFGNTSSVRAIWSSFASPSYTPLTEVVGSISSTITAKTDSYEWRVEPSVSLSSVLFVFTALNINTAELFIYDQDVQNPVFSCVACGTLLPPPFRSNTGSVRIVFKGVNGASFTASNCKLQYVGQLTRLADSTESRVNTDITLNMAYGSISPTLIQNTLPRSSMLWRINLVRPMTFAFTSFDFDASCAATLTIYDGPSTSSKVLFSSCSNVNEPHYWINSTSAQTLIVLTSTTSSTSSFLLEYFADADLYHCGALLLPNVLTAPSMAIFDGSASTKEMRRSEACEWSIYGTPIQPAVLLFKWVFLKLGGSVQVFDNNKKGVLLWDSGTRGTTIVPPPLQSRSGPLHVVYASNTQLPYQAAGFFAEYFTRGNEYGIGTRQEVYSMSSAVAISLPASSYPSMFRYSWLLQPLASTGQLILFVNKISLNDELRVYDAGSGALLSVLIGDVAPSQWIYSSSGRALLSMSSNTNNSGSFDIDYYTDGANYHCGFPVNPANIRSRSRILTDGSKSNEAIFINQQCEWMLQPPGTTGIVLYFTRMSLFNADVTIFDENDNVISYITNTEAVPAPISLYQSSTVRIKYSSSSSASGTGFALTYFSINDEYSGPGDRVIWLHAASMLSLSLPDASTNYIWYIKPKSVTEITVVFAELQVDCSSSSLAVYSGSSVSLSSFIGEYCGNEAPTSWFHFPYPDITIVYSTTTQQSSNYFDLSYFSDAPSYHCGIATVTPGILTAPSMRISDGSVTNAPMIVNDTCAWVITPPEADRLVLEFTSNNLLGAKMWVYDGADDSAVLLWFCDGCALMPSPLVSTSNTIYIKYISPTHVSSGTGFVVTYWSIYNSAQSSDVLLESPQQYALSTHIHRNLSLGWELGLSTEAAKVNLQSLTAGDSSALSFTDGRQQKQDFYSALETVNHCGLVTSSEASRLLSSNFAHAATQSTSYILSNSSSKQLVSISNSGSQKGFLNQPSVCKYIIHNKEHLERSVELLIIQYKGNSHSRLTIYSGLNGYESVLLDVISSAHLKNKKIVFPCGKGAILLENNDTENILEFTYRIVDTDRGKHVFDMVVRHIR